MAWWFTRDLPPTVVTITLCAKDRNRGSGSSAMIRSWGVFSQRASLTERHIYYFTKSASQTQTFPKKLQKLNKKNRGGNNNYNQPKRHQMGIRQFKRRRLQKRKKRKMIVVVGPVLAKVKMKSKAPPNRPHNRQTLWMINRKQIWHTKK